MDWIWWLREETMTKTTPEFLVKASGQTLAPFTKTGVPEEGQDGGSRLSFYEVPLDFMSKRQYGNGGAHWSGAQRRSLDRTPHIRSRLHADSAEGKTASRSPEDEMHDQRWRLRHGTAWWKQMRTEGKKGKLRHRSHGKTVFPEGIIPRTNERSNKMRTKMQNASLHFCVGKIGKFLIAAFCFPIKLEGCRTEAGTEYVKSSCCMGQHVNWRTLVGPPDSCGVRTHGPAGLRLPGRHGCLGGPSPRTFPIARSATEAASISANHPGQNNCALAMLMPILWIVLKQLSSVFGIFVASMKYKHQFEPSEHVVLEQAGLGTSDRRA